MALLVAGLYLAAGCILRTVANHMAFHRIPATYVSGGEFRFLTTEDGAKIAACFLPQPQARFTILYLHGNGSELGRDRPFLEQLHAHGFAVLAIDYRGYGLSDGDISERAVHADVRAAWKFLREEQRVPAERIIVYGYSLGGGSAVELAASQPVAGLILQATFTSVFAVQSRPAAAVFAPFDIFRNRARIADVPCPVLLLHGRADRVVPFSHGESLLAAAREPKRAVWLDAAGHGDLIRRMGRDYWTILGEFTGRL